MDLCYEQLAELRARAEANLQGSMALKTSTPQSVFDREAFASHSRKRLHAVSVSEHQLVFGRMDLDEEPRPVYVGRIGLAGRDQERILIDWRAPVGSAFYRATALAPRGVVRRRTLITRARKVVDINDDLLMPDKAQQMEVVAGEGALLNALVRERGEFMQDIVSTIQGEQDEVIRTDPKGSVLLTGGPGTGKSVVALHRTAYLMYERAAELERLGVLVVGPGQRFSRYISRVLPSLGETSVNIRSVFDITAPIVATEREPLGVARTKGSEVMSKVMKRFLVDSYPEVEGNVKAKVAGRTVTVEARRLKALRSEVLSARTDGLNNATDQLWLGLARVILAQAGGKNPKRGELKGMARSLADDRDTLDMIESLLPQRTGNEVFKQLKANPSALLPHLRQEVSRAEAAALIEDLQYGSDPKMGDLPLIDELSWLLGPRRADVAPEPEQDPEYAEVTTAQDRLDMVRQLEFSGAKGQGYGHVVVDEAQDITAMQWRMLARRGEDATWTIVGDPAQATLASPGEMEASVARIVRGTRLSRFALGINYRTPKEIMDYASKASGLSMGNLQSIRSGTKPVFFRYQGSSDSALAKAIAWLGDRSGSGCILVLDQADLEPVEANSEGTEVIWALDAKGLEFDNVILFRPEATDTSKASDASLLLIGATRATKGLAVVTERSA